MIPPIADSDPDPTTQIPWPAARSRQTVHLETSADAEAHDGRVEEEATKIKIDPAKHRLSTWNLITLSISMAGAQIAWTVELG